MQRPDSRLCIGKTTKQLVALNSKLPQTTLDGFLPNPLRYLFILCPCYKNTIITMVILSEQPKA